MKKALITGITGQDGSYLTELLLEKDYEVHGMVRSASTFNRSRIDKILQDEKYRDKLFVHYGDVVDTSSIRRILEKVEPDEIYNLAAQSHVKISFDVPDYTAQVDALGTLRFLDAIREEGIEKKIRFYQASTSELYGKVQEIPQNEVTHFTHDHLTQQLNFLDIGQLKIIAKHMEYLHQTEFFLIMNHQEGVKIL